MREIGVYYHDQGLGIDRDGLHLVDMHFVEEGKEKRIDNDVFHGEIIGKLEPRTGTEGPWIALLPDGGGTILYVRESLGGDSYE